MEKKNLILGGVLILLIVVAYAYQGPIKQWRSDFGRPKNFLAKIQMAKIDKIEIVGGGKTEVLEKKDDKWMTGGAKGFYLSKPNADEIMNTLMEAQKADFELVSSNKDKKNNFAVGDRGIKIKLFSENKEKTDFVIGKLTDDGLGNYLSRESLSDIFVIKMSLYPVFSNSEWRDLSIFKTDKDSISKIRFQYPDREFVVEKKGGKWEMKNPKKEVKEEKIGKILDIMSGLTAVKIPEQTFKGTGLEKHMIIVEASGNGVNNVIMVGDKNKDGLFYAKSGASDHIYLIAKPDRDELDKRVDRF